MSSEAPFAPDWASPPGDSIRLLMSTKGIAVEALCERIGICRPMLAGILAGSCAITPEIAIALERVFGSKSAYWRKRESRYAGQLAHLVSDATKAIPAWVKDVPFTSMRSLGWITDAGSSASEKLVAAIRFFGISSQSEFTDMQDAMLGRVAFKHTTTFESQSLPLAVWLRQAEIMASAVSCSKWNKQLFTERLVKIRALTRTKLPETFLPQLRDICAECGVALVLVRTPSNCHVTAATRFLRSDKAMIALSGRYRSDDHFWFAFFHEAAHLILHSQTKLFLEADDADESRYELEANDFAARMLVPAQEIRQLQSTRLSTEIVIKTARRLGISSGILVGQLQYIGRLPRTHLNTLKRRYTWDSLMS